MELHTFTCPDHEQVITQTVNPQALCIWPTKCPVVIRDVGGTDDKDSPLLIVRQQFAPGEVYGPVYCGRTLNHRMEHTDD